MSQQNNRRSIKGLWNDFCDMQNIPKGAWRNLLGIGVIFAFLLGIGIATWSGLTSKSHINPDSQVSAIPPSTTESIPEEIDSNEMLKMAARAENNYKFSEAIEYYEKLLQIYIDEYGDNNIRVAHISARIGSNYLDLNEIISAGKYIEAASLAADIIIPTGNNYILLGDIYIEKANLHVRNSEFIDAINTYDKILRMYEQHSDKKSQELAIIYTNLSNIYSKIDKYSDALLYADRAYVLYRDYLGTSSIDCGRTLAALGSIYMYTDANKALDYYEKSYNIFKANAPYANVQLIDACSDLIRLDDKKSYEYAKEAFDLASSIYGEFHQTTIVRQADLSTFCDSDIEAIKILDAAVSKSEKAYGTNSIESAFLYNHLGDAYLNVGYIEKAANLYEDSLKIFIEQLGNQHTFVAEVYGKFSSLYFEKNDFILSMHYAEKAQDIYRYHYNEVNAPVANMYVLLGRSSYSNGSDDINTALTYFEKAKRIYTDLYGSYNAQTAYADMQIAIIYASKDDKRLAIEYIENAKDIYNHVYGDTHSNMATLLKMYAGIDMSFKDYNKAIIKALQAIDIAEIYSLEPSAFAQSCYYILCCSYFGIGDYDNALKSAYKTIDLVDKNNLALSASIDYSGAYSILALCYSVDGDKTNAIRSINMAIDIVEETSNQFQKYTIYNSASIVYCNLNDLETALDYANKSYGISVATSGPDHADAIATLENIRMLESKLQSDFR